MASFLLLLVIGLYCPNSRVVVAAIATHSHTDLAAPDRNRHSRGHSYLYDTDNLDRLLQGSGGRSERRDGPESNGPWLDEHVEPGRRVRGLEGRAGGPVRRSVMAESAPLYSDCRFWVGASEQALKMRRKKLAKKHRVFYFWDNNKQVSIPVFRCFTFTVELKIKAQSY
jgi:hypothetical protein